MLNAKYLVRFIARDWRPNHGNRYFTGRFVSSWGHSQSDFSFHELYRQRLHLWEQYTVSIKADGHIMLKNILTSSAPKIYLKNWCHISTFCEGGHFSFSKIHIQKWGTFLRVSRARSQVQNFEGLWNYFGGGSGVLPGKSWEFGALFSHLSVFQGLNLKYHIVGIKFLPVVMIWNFDAETHQAFICFTKTTV